MSTTNISFTDNIPNLGTVVPVGYVGQTGITTAGQINITFTGLDSLIYIFATKAKSPNTYTGTAADLKLPANAAYLNTATAALNTFLGQYSSTRPLPQTWDAFISAIQSYTTSTLNTDTISENLSSPLDGFGSEYRFVTKSVDITGQTAPYTVTFQDPVGGDFAPLADSSSGLTGLPVTAAALTTQFKSAFSNFLANYDYSLSATGATANTDRFFTEFHTFLTLTSDLSQSVLGLTSYQQVYNAFFPSATTADFNTFLQKFYINATSASGSFFIPSQSFGSFVDSVRNAYFTSIYSTPTPNKVSTDTGASEKLLVLNQIFALLSELIGVLQNVAIAQSTRLNFLTAWQKAYTDLMNQVPTFVQGDTNSPANATGSDTASINVRSDLNTKANAIIERLRGSRSLVSDMAKALQTNFNQTSDAVNQQANMATSIIQQFSTILGSIFR